MKRILIAVNNGPTSKKVASAGFQLAKKLKAEIALLSVVDTTGLLTEGGITAAEMATSIKTGLEKTEAKLIDKVFKKHKLHAFIEKGVVYKVILKTAEKLGTDIIVLGTHGRTGISHLLMGSVAEKVTRHSKKPLFIIPTKK